MGQNLRPFSRIFFSSLVSILFKRFTTIELVFFPVSLGVDSIFSNDLLRCRRFLHFLEFSSQEIDFFERRWTLVFGPVDLFVIINCLERNTIGVSF